MSNKVTKTVTGWTSNATNELKLAHVTFDNMGLRPERTDLCPRKVLVTVTVEDAPREPVLTEDEQRAVNHLEYIADCVMAGMARTGNVYELKMPPELLTKAFQNTVELLKQNVEVCEALPDHRVEWDADKYVGEKGKA